MAETGLRQNGGLGLQVGLARMLVTNSQLSFPKVTLARLRNYDCDVIRLCHDCVRHSCDLNCIFI